MLPLYYPTTVLVVDDDRDFLSSFEYRYRNRLKCRSTNSPKLAIDLLEDDEKRSQLKPLLSKAVNAEKERGGHVVKLGLSELGALSKDEQRHDKISVVVVDYAMPEMTGLEFCRAIDCYSVKRLLLTGKAGMDVAVNAFNEGVIESFALKGDPDIGKKLEHRIKKLQESYFEEFTAPINSISGLSDLQFLNDKNFFDFFNCIQQEYDVQEYFLSTEPEGLVIISKSGVRRLLIVCNLDTMRAQAETAISAGAPEALQGLLDDKAVILTFPTATAFYEPPFANDWSEFALPAQEVPKSNQWWWAITDDF